MRLAYSWPMRWKTRSAPERSTPTATPGYLASKPAAIRSAAARSIEVYQATLPSFRAAETSSGVMALAGGAAESTRVAVALRARAVEAFSTARRVIFEPGIVTSCGADRGANTCHGNGRMFNFPNHIQRT